MKGCIKNGHSGAFGALSCLLVGFLGFLVSDCGRLLNLSATQDSVHEALPVGLADTVYMEAVHSVQLAPKDVLTQGQIAPAVIPLHHPEPLVLMFDVLSDNYTAYYAEVLLCRSDGQLAQQVLVQSYLAGMNYFPIVDYVLVAHTDPSYVRYRLEVPRVQQSGMYVLRVRRVDTREAVMALRFAVYGKEVAIQAHIAFSDRVRTRDGYHRIVVQADYRALKNTDPHRDWYLVLRQNGDPHTDKVLLRPTRVNLANQQVTYAALDGSADFRALLPFRFCDLRYLTTSGVGVERVRRKQLRYTATLTEDSPRTKNDFTFQPDLNGGYQYPLNQTNPYIEVQFRFFAPEQLPTPLFVVGQFNLWNRAPKYQLHYDSLHRSYRSTLLLKQGYYNYAYASQTKPPYRTEGAHFNSQNQYEVFLFTRPWGGITNPLVGYARFNGQL